MKRDRVEKIKEAEQFQQTEESRQLAAQIAEQIARTKDDKAFETAKSLGTPQALEDYLKEYPSGLHLEEAEKALVQAQEEQKKKEQERKRILANSIRLRSQYKLLDTAEVRDMVVSHGFFEKYYNNNGDFKNNFELRVIQQQQVVVDNATGLMWHQSGSVEYMPLKRVQEWLDKLNREKYAGYTDWRLPTVEEAVSLMEKDEQRGGLYVDSVFSSEQRYIWTGDTAEANEVWAIDFFGGDLNKVTKTSNAFIRPVRSLQ